MHRVGEGFVPYDVCPFFYICVAKRSKIKGLEGVGIDKHERVEKVERLAYIFFYFF